LREGRPASDRFVDRLRNHSAGPVVDFRLPGAQHSFDLFRSLRFDHVVDGIVAFLTLTRTQPAQNPDTPASGGRSPGAVTTG
jgi:hypothetical protein